MSSTEFTFIDSYGQWKSVFLNYEYDIDPKFFEINITFEIQNKTLKNRKRKCCSQDFLELTGFHQSLKKVLDNFLKNFESFETINEKSNMYAKNLGELLLSEYELVNIVKKGESDYVNKVVKNDTTSCREITIGLFTFVMPPNSKFIMSDIIQSSSLLLSMNEKYDLIVIDPPVTNKSVKKHNAYNCIDEMDLISLPLEQLLSKQGIVAAWCTNSQICIDSLQNCLFGAWRLEQVAEITWLKVTKSGETVLDLNNTFRRPYERLFVGRFIDGKCESSYHSEDDPLERLDGHVIISVPCSLHSAKPNLQKFFSSFLPENPKCLELFARNLFPNWTSWGNEPVKFMRKDLMVPKQR